jgi:DEAD/DEAH box helicase domain-containing protein
VIFVDVETQDLIFDRVNDGKSRISFAGAYDSDHDTYYSFWEKDLGALEDLLLSADRVVGFNIWGFDYAVLAPYMKRDLRVLPTIDLMLAMKKAVGFWPSLDSLARANIGGGKIGKGSDAPGYWKNGELDELETYCLEDVRLTYEVWKVGEEARRLKYFDRSGFIQETNVNWQDGFMQKVDQTVQGRLL